MVDSSSSPQTATASSFDTTRAASSTHRTIKHYSSAPSPKARAKHSIQSSAAYSISQSRSDVRLIIRDGNISQEEGSPGHYDIAPLIITDGTFPKWQNILASFPQFPALPSQKLLQSGHSGPL